MEVCGQLHAAAALPLGNQPPVPIAQEALWAHEPAWTLCRREKSLATGIEVRLLGCPALNLVAILTELSRL
jgi:hypothetical protein